MNQRKRDNLRLAFLGLVFLFVASGWWIQDEPEFLEPSHEGKPLRYWLGAMSNPKFGEARIREAFREMGPRAVPALVWHAKKADPPWNTIYRKGYELAPGFLRGWMPFPETAGMMSQYCQWGLYLSVAGPRAARDAHYLVEGLSSPFARDRVVMVTLLGGIGNKSKRAMNGLKQALKDPDPKVRWQAALMFFHADPSDPVAVPQLIEALGSPSAFLRSDAVLALSRVGGQSDTRVMAAIEKAMEDSSEHVRVEASEALTRLRGEKQSPGAPTSQ